MMILECPASVNSLYADVALLGSPLPLFLSISVITLYPVLMPTTDGLIGICDLSIIGTFKFNSRATVIIPILIYQ
jgi:hypothetical protein